MKWEHINILQRKAISSGLAQRKQLKEIAEITGLDPTSISKEIIRNRIKIKQGTRKKNHVKGCLDSLDAVMDVLKNIRDANTIVSNTKLKPLKRRQIDG